jgi:alkylation response protein AidB-like acyl-CoA dehydrogenase
MDFAIPEGLQADLDRYEAFLAKFVLPYLSEWYRQGVVPRQLFEQLGSSGWLGFEGKAAGFVGHSALSESLRTEALARVSPGLAVAILAHISLGSLGVYRFGSESQKATYLAPAIEGKTLICLGNTEPHAGSDVAAIATQARQVQDGWRISGTKAYATNGAISDAALITAVTDPDAPRSSRLSMFIVDLSAPGVTRTELNKRVWIPSDLTRLRFEDVFVPDANLLGNRGKGLQQVLEIFTHSRLAIAALTLGTADGAFRLALDHARKRRIFGHKIVELQAKAFEMADLFSRLEAARLAVQKACWVKDQGRDFRIDASVAKYLTVEIARAVAQWSADLFGAASVIFDHPIHKFPMDAWASSLGEGTQDVQKLIIARELLKQEG